MNSHTTKNSLSDANKSKFIKKLTFMLFCSVFALFLLAGCGPNHKTPEAIFKDYVKAWEKNDASTAWKCISPEVKKKKYADDFKKFKSEMDSQNDAKMKTLLNELITLEAKDFCTKIDGKWYVNFGTVH